MERVIVLLNRPILSYNIPVTDILATNLECDLRRSTSLKSNLLEATQLHRRLVWIFLAPKKSAANPETCCAEEDQALLSDGAQWIA